MQVYVTIRLILISTLLVYKQYSKLRCSQGSKAKVIFFINKTSKEIIKVPLKPQRVQTQHYVLWETEPNRRNFRNTSEIPEISM